MQSTQLPPLPEIMIGGEESEPFVHEDGMISWLDYTLIDDPDLKSIFYDQLLQITPQTMNIDGGDSSQFIPFTPLDTTAPPSPPPILPGTEVDNFCGLLSGNAGRFEPGSSNSKGVGSESPVVVCGSVSAVTAASGGGGSEAVPSDGGGGVADVKSENDRKRKGKGKEKEKEEGKENSTVKLESSIDEKKQARKSTSNKRTRVAAVHNLSERRRRDRINEKMRTLKRLIPPSSKKDKVSMLDDAIVYLKSLQMQVNSPNVAPTIYVPNVNNPMVQYPNMFAGPTFSSPVGDAQVATTYAYPAFHMGHVPNIDPSKIQAMNQSNHVQCLPAGIVQNVNQPSFPISLEQYQQFLQMQIQIHMQMRMQMQMQMLAAANLSNQSAVPQGTLNQQTYPGYANVVNHNPGNRAADPRVRMRNPQPSLGNSQERSYDFQLGKSR